MWDPGSVSSSDEAGWRPFVEGLLQAQRHHELETEIIDLFPRRPPAGGFAEGSQADAERLSARLGPGTSISCCGHSGYPGLGSTTSYR